MSKITIYQVVRRNQLGAYMDSDGYTLRDDVGDTLRKGVDDIVSQADYTLPDGFTLGEDRLGLPRIYKDGMDQPCEIGRAPEGGIAVLYGVGPGDYIVLDEIGG